MVDPGLPLVELAGAEGPAPELTKRDVVPEIILPLGSAAAAERVVAEAQASTGATSKEDARTRSP